MSKLMRQEEAIANMSRRHNNKFDYSKVVFKDYRSPITIICPKHGEYVTNYEKHMQDSALKSGCCPGCVYDARSSNKISYEETLKRINEKFPDKGYNVTLDAWKEKGVNIWVTCPKHGSWYANRYWLFKGDGCPKCNVEKRTRAQTYTADDFIKKAIEKHGNKYDYSRVEYKGTEVPVEIICPIHGSFWQRLHAHSGSQKRGCPECWKQDHPSLQPKKIETFIKDARAVHGDKYNYDKVVYINNKVPVVVTCPEHGDFSVKPNNHLTGKSGCPMCSTSAPEKVIWNFLHKNNIKFIYQYKVEYFDYRWDFYINDLNVVIEYNGEQHYKQIKYFNQEAIKARDFIKKQILSYLNIKSEYITYETKLNEIPIELCKILSKYKKFFYNGNFYKTIAELSKEVKSINPNTNIADLDKYLTKNIYLNNNNNV